MSEARPQDVVEPPSPPEPPDTWDRAAHWLAARGAVPAVALLTLGLALLYHHVFAGELAGDDLTFHMAEARRLADQLAAGDWDFWNPNANGGFASLYYYQAIPQLAAAIPTAVLGGDFVFWFQLSVFLPLVVVPVAAYRGMRLLGATPWQAFAGGFAVAFAVGQSRWGHGADGTFQVGLYTQTWALAGFPLALGHAVRWIRDGRGLAAAVAWGAFCGLCHPFAGISLGLAVFAGLIAQLVGAFAARRPAGRIALVAVLGIGLAINLALAVVHGKLAYLVPITLCAAATGRVAWELATHAPPAPREVGGLRGFGRLLALGGCLLVAALPGWLTVIVDYAGFGGFPHRVNDEVGPGYQTLMQWQLTGHILDYRRPVAVLTWAIPVVVLLARTRYLRWLGAPAVVYAALLAIGPHMGKTADDLLPAVRFLGTMQIAIALALGAGTVAIGTALWHRPPPAVLRRAFPRRPDSDLVYAVRTALACVAAALVIAIASPAARFIATERVRVLGDYPGSHRAEMMLINDALRAQPAGRKQVGPGAENHWWNQLSYVYARRPALLQMGGGGLQASPNYDFVWSVRDFAKLAWVFDTPLFVFRTDKADATVPAGRTLFRTAHYELRLLAAPGLVSAVEITGTLPADKKAARAAAIAWLKTDAAYADQVLAYAGHGPTPNQPSTPIAATIVRAGRDSSAGDAADIFAEVDARAPTTVMARESWHPRWRAYLDGRPAPIRRLTPDFPAVDVPAGRHLVQWRFERPWWAHAAWLAWPGTTLLAWLALRLLSRRRGDRSA